MSKTVRFNPDEDASVASGVEPLWRNERSECSQKGATPAWRSDSFSSASQLGQTLPTTLPSVATPERSDPPASPYPRVRTFARRGDRMGDTLERTFEKYKHAYLLDLERGAGVTMVAETARLDPLLVFGREAPLIVEVGCGNGEQIVHAAANHPENNYLGFEVWLPGIAKIVSSAVRNFDGLPNLKVADVDALQALPILFADYGGGAGSTRESRLMNATAESGWSGGLGESANLGDSREISSPIQSAEAEVLGEASPGVIKELWTFFADPWPKHRHKKRRLVAPEFAGIAADLLVDGGLWRMATDWADYAWQMRDVIEATPGLVNVYAGKRPDPEDPEGMRGGFAPRFEGRVVTAFERRAGREGREVRDLCARRVVRGSEEERQQAAALRVVERLGRERLEEKPIDSGFEPRDPWYHED